MLPLPTLQLDSNDCGPSCLLYIIRYFGGQVRATELRQKCEMDDAGMSLLGISEAASQYGIEARFFKARRFDVELNSISPWLAEMEVSADGSRHYVIVRKVNNQFIHLMDPAIGNIRIPTPEFDSAWTGKVGTFKAERKMERFSSDFSDLIRWVIRPPRTWFLLLSIVTALLTASFGIVAAYIMQSLIDSISDNSLGKAVWLTLGALLIFIIIRFLVTVGSSYILERVTVKMSVISTLESGSKIDKLKWEYLRRMRHGDLVNRFKDPDHVERFLIISGGRTLSFVLSFIIGMTWVAILYPYLIPAVAFSAIVSVSTFLLFRSSLLSISYRQKIHDVRIDSILMDYARCREMLESAGASNYLIRKFNGEYAARNLLHLRRIRLLICIGFILTFAPLLVMTWAGYLAWNGHNSDPSRMGDFIFQVTAISFIFGGISSALNMFSQMDMMRVSFDRIIDIQRGPEKAKAGSAPNTDENLSTLALKAVIYKVGSTTQCLDFKAEKSTTESPCMIAVTGANGSGKSSLLRVLAGVAEFDSGAILINGESLGSSELRSLTAYLPQSAQLISGNALENIVLSEKFDDFPLLSSVAEVVGMPRGARTAADMQNIPITNGGENMSGGQAKRIAVARTLLLDARVLLLDEAFAGLDTESIGRITEYLRHSNYDFIIYTTHDSHALQVSDYRIHLD